MIQVGKHGNPQVILSPTAEPCGQGCSIIQLPLPPLPKEAARLRQAAFHREEFADCIQMALAFVVCFAVTLAASALLRGTGEPREIAQYLQTAFHFLAAASGFAGLVAVGLALVHRIQLRQV